MSLSPRSTHRGVSIYIHPGKEYPICDLGLTLGLVAGAAQAVGQVQAANHNSALIKQSANLEYAGQEREFLVKADAANKEAYQASLEGDRAKAAVIAQGEGMGGSTAGARVAEQARQTALSIQNAKDQREGARANYVMAGKVTKFETKAALKDRASVNPMAAFTNIASAGLQGYGAFNK